MKRVIIVLLAACGGGSQKPAPAQPAPTETAAVKPEAATCVQVSEKMGVFLATDDNAPPEDQRPAILAAVKAHCEKDGWSAEARDCVATAETHDDAMGCAKLFTEAQVEAMQNDQTIATPKAEPAAAAAPPDAAPAPKEERRSRGATPKKPSKASDPDQGGE